MKKYRMFILILSSLALLSAILLAAGISPAQEGLIIIVLAFAQNTAFTMVSRSRNRDSLDYHAVASLFSNCLWFLTFRELLVRDFPLDLFTFYALGTIAGSVFGAKISMFIERKLDASADGHLNK